MRHHRPFLMCIAVSFLVGLVGCAEAPTASPPMQADAGMSGDPLHAVAPAEGTQEGQPSGEIQERAVPMPGGAEPPTIDPRTRPSITRPPIPPTTGGTSAGPMGGVGGGLTPPSAGSAPPPTFVGPTENITRVANAFSMRSKSLTIFVTVAQGLQLTQPVTISISTYGPQGGGGRVTQYYFPSTGNRFLHQDPVGDGKPRTVDVDVALTEPKPGGGVYSFTFGWRPPLDPLYDVSIGPLDFWLVKGCDVTAVNEIWFAWWRPDGSHQRFSFNTKQNEHTIINAFAWTGAETSAAMNLHMPTMEFREIDVPCFPNFTNCGFAPGMGPSDVNLVPGVTRRVFGTLTERGCESETYYDITYNLRRYVNL